GKAEVFDLSGDVTRPGFVLLSVQGRNLCWPTTDPRDGAHHDTFHRDLGAPSGNRDIANLDRLIDAMVEDGAVDPDRIFVSGWSNGGFFAQLYAIGRHDQPTPGGNTVAAATVFSAADPFHAARADEDPSCRLDPYPTSDAPIFVVSRACDLVACDADQAADLVADDVPLAPGFVVESWMDDLASEVGDDNASWRIVDGWGQQVDECTGPALCGPVIASLGHLRWPDGVADGSGIDHEADMLAFLRAPAP
nr:prolyl oligopeptidase family serine peptidase [bacterium]